ncbi:MULTISPECIES: glycyl-radical enzyme activating protein [Desulfitobacterium]|uniref:Glycyl-radical enzyme activator family protein n=1 Tax=Desulfitobacterium dehalogenans (strain ATCC 51507 / DSM 9161 / JW/IU-DC1) TaxID=756499 RepID=I4A4E9_DESDJ|nr:MULTISPECIES: glycyl-radical enzyme activating protein [Desulfitobacterium]AFL98833.1 glycyl-radical enzyme activator family protein [Desulfitobacterium dehalogenans ATCC 51507]
MGESRASDERRYGLVFNIQHYSVHDGPGIRTIIFTKGCPLRCEWCSNPESQQTQPQLGFNPHKCIGIKACFRCAEVCVYGAIKLNTEENDKIFVDRKFCTDCVKCVDVCPSQALQVFGKPITVEEAIREVEKDSVFYARSGGGLTISGGEPLMQADFVTETLKEARKRRLKTTIETCGYADWPSMENVCQYLTSIIMDIKCMDSEKHKKYTGAPNELILENFNKLCEGFPKLPKLIRTPVVPGFNDTEEDIKEIANLVKGKLNVTYELLKYHRLGQQKYHFLGKDYPLSDTQLGDAKFEQLKELAKSILD